MRSVVSMAPEPAHNPNRLYARYLFSNGVLDKIVFVKTGPVYNVEVDRFMGACDHPYFLSPKQIASFKDGDQMVAAWEFVDGSHPRTADEEPHELTRIVCAIAGVNSVTEAALSSGVSVRATTPWVEPMAAAMQTWVASGGGSVVDPRLVDDFVYREPARLARFLALGAKFVTHHDIKDANLILPNGDDRVAVIDWGTVSLAPAGSGIRFACRFGENTRRLVAHAYVAAMSKLGIELDVADVRCAMETHQVY